LVNKFKLDVGEIEKFSIDELYDICNEVEVAIDFLNDRVKGLESYLHVLHKEIVRKERE
jgi:hypothetical protein